jgi:hypothetical protein
LAVTLTSWINLLGVIIALLGVTASNLLIRRQIKIFLEQLDAHERNMRMDYKLALRTKALSYSLYSNLHLRDARLNIEEVFKAYIREQKVIPRSRIQQETDENHELYSDIMTLLAHWENMALAIYSDVADKQVAKNMVAFTLVKHVHIFSEFINDRKHVNPRAYSNLLRLADEWREALAPPPDDQYDPSFQ